MAVYLSSKTQQQQRGWRAVTAGILVCMTALLGNLIPSIAQATGQQTEVQLTPLLLAVPSAPIPFTGSDGRTHLVYELQLTNFTSSEATVQRVDILGDDQTLVTLDEAAIATRLQPFGVRTSTAVMAPGLGSLLFVHVNLPLGTTPPQRLTHRVTAHFANAPPGFDEVTVSGGKTLPLQRKPVIIGPPLAGERYIAADSCCDSTRHMRAALPVNGHVRLAQRFAVDWEQADAQHRIYAGPKETLRSYTIYGKEALAVADARVVSVLDGLPEQVPGQFPANIPIAEADGNSVVLDLGDGNFALYAHLQPGSLRVKAGDQVVRGQVLGLVGNTGNSIAPHLHFHVMDGPSPLDSNGLPYEIDSFVVTGRTPGTEAFDEAEANGTPLAIMPQVPALGVTNALPMDQSLIRFSR
ncbi:M23 family metallopeptidase [Oxalobacteraceae bacterium OM1]|nr:M23 family metallopeptidase [Oxalobacteraceae bacterium OM1]